MIELLSCSKSGAVGAAMAAAEAPFAVGGGKAQKGSLLLCAEAAAAAGTKRPEAREELLELYSAAHGKPTTPQEVARANGVIGKALLKVGYVAPPPGATRNVQGKLVYANVRDAPSPPPERRAVGSRSSSSSRAAAAAAEGGGGGGGGGGRRQ